MRASLTESYNSVEDQLNTQNENGELHVLTYDDTN